MVHLEPSQRSASANCPEPLLPTAVQARGEVHETALSWFHCMSRAAWDEQLTDYHFGPDHPPGTGAGRTDHAAGA
jgi:hypothetical protein